MISLHTRATRDEITSLSERLRLDRTVHRRALELAGLTVCASDWVRLMARLLLAFGAAFIAAGIAAFVAYNWAAMHAFAKFAGVELALVAAIGCAAWRGLDSRAGQASLLVGGLLVGVLLALFGQVYQTGADPYGLFLTWALLVSGWALVGRQLALWMLILVLANLAFVMYWTQLVQPPSGWWDLNHAMGPMVWLPLTVTDPGLSTWLFALNVTVLIAWEACAARNAVSDGPGAPGTANRWFPRAIALATLAITTIGTWAFILDVTGSAAGGALAPVCFVILVGGSLWYYASACLDLGMLTANLTALIVIVTTVIVRAIDLDQGAALLVAVLVLAQTIGATLWLKRLGGIASKPR